MGSTWMVSACCSMQLLSEGVRSLSWQWHASFNFPAPIYLRDLFHLSRQVVDVRLPVRTPIFVHVLAYGIVHALDEEAFQSSFLIHCRIRGPHGQSHGHTPSRRSGRVGRT